MSALQSVTCLGCRPPSALAAFVIAPAAGVRPVHGQPGGLLPGGGRHRQRPVPAPLAGPDGHRVRCGQPTIVHCLPPRALHPNNGCSCCRAAGAASRPSSHVQPQLTDVVHVSFAAPRTAAPRTFSTRDVITIRMPTAAISSLQPRVESLGYPRCFTPSPQAIGGTRSPGGPTATTTARTPTWARGAAARGSGVGPRGPPTRSCCGACNSSAWAQAEGPVTSSRPCFTCMHVVTLSHPFCQSGTVPYLRTQYRQTASSSLSACALSINACRCNAANSISPSESGYPTASASLPTRPHVDMHRMYAHCRTAQPLRPALHPLHPATTKASAITT